MGRYLPDPVDAGVAERRIGVQATGYGTSDLSLTEFVESRQQAFLLCDVAVYLLRLLGNKPHYRLLLINRWLNKRY